MKEDVPGLLPRGSSDQGLIFFHRQISAIAIIPKRGTTIITTVPNVKVAQSEIGWVVFIFLYGGYLRVRFRPRTSNQGLLFLRQQLIVFETSETVIVQVGNKS